MWCASESVPCVSGRLRFERRLFVPAGNFIFRPTTSRALRTRARVRLHQDLSPLSPPIHLPVLGSADNGEITAEDCPVRMDGEKRGSGTENSELRNPLRSLPLADADMRRTRPPKGLKAIIP